jgi:hypothetical protein
MQEFTNTLNEAKNIKEYKGSDNNNSNFNTNSLPEPLNNELNNEQSQQVNNLNKFK